MRIREQMECELARREFWYYCKLMANDFYKKDKEYLYDFCNELENFYYSDDNIFICNMPPRFGKSRTATLFVQWLLGINNKLKIMTGSYNEILSTTFSRQVRNTISEKKADEDKIVYSDIFPNTNIKYGEAASNLWSLEGNSYKNYLATSPTGTATGFGADLIIIDDIIKSEFEANNDNTLEKHWNWFTDTMLSRLEGKRKIIIIMTRWATKDLCGRAIEHFENIGLKVRKISLKAYDNNRLLCPDILDYKQYNILKESIGENIFNANYNQEPIDLKGVLYTHLMEYDILPDNISSIDNYTDTADTGNDYLCSINYAVSGKEAYILDVIYTKEGMDITEQKVAEMLKNDNVNYCRIESNNGGRGFSRNVDRLSKNIGNNHTVFKPFHQSANKNTRILTGSTGVMKNIYFPKNWKNKFPEFYKDVTTYQREGKNKNDDAQDTLTGIYEMISKKVVRSGLKL